MKLLLIVGVEPTLWTYKDHMLTDTLYELNWMCVCVCK